MKPESLQQFLAWQAPFRMFLLYPLLPKGAVMFFYGGEATWKSWLMLDLGFSIAEGQDWMGYQTTSARVLLYNPEIPKPEYQNRVNQYITKKRGGLLNGTGTNLFFETSLDRKLDTAYGYVELESGITQCAPDVVILDGLYKVMSSNSSVPEVERFIDNIDKLKAKYNTSFVIVHHTRQELVDTRTRQALDLGTSEMLGSSLWRDWADSILKVEEVRDANHELIRLVVQKSRFAETILPTNHFHVDRQRLKFWFI